MKIKSVCERCHLLMTLCVRNGKVEPVCVCCDPAFQRGVLLDCKHPA